MSIHGVAHQKAAIAARIVGQRGEATSARIIDETPSPRLEAADAGKEQEQEQSLPRLLEQVLARENLRRAWKRVKKNRGAAGVDGKDILQTGLHLQSAWPQIRQALLTGRYRPEPVRRVMIAKPDGSLRELGIPTVTDRLIQQALLQVLQPMIDPSFSEHSHGFRPGRRAQDAVLKAQQHVQAGYPIVVRRVQSKDQAADASKRWAQYGGVSPAAAALRVGLEGLLRVSANTGRLARA